MKRSTTILIMFGIVTMIILTLYSFLFSTLAMLEIEKLQKKVETLTLEVRENRHRVGEKSVDPNFRVMTDLEQSV